MDARPPACTLYLNPKRPPARAGSFHGPGFVFEQPNERQVAGSDRSAGTTAMGVENGRHSRMLHARAFITVRLSGMTDREV
ncbi:hypothetical protein CHELA40_20002 [Chelatococcus asaccharovorans]|nr:hypothetical protein CHELA17_10060 [Chelatococcus asaccharovorans]CAH1687119.1 hypothetical protein CHELA40_20002 [Chelatococcus asaccharovorans]